MAASCMSLALSSGALGAAVCTRSDATLAKRPTALAAVGPISLSASDLGLTLCRPSIALPAQRRASRCAAFAASSDFEQDVYTEQAPYEQPAYGGNQPPAYGAPEQGTKLYVGNLPWDVDSKQLATFFQDVGPVELVEVIYDRDTGRSRGFAFVTMSSQEDAVYAIERLDGYDLGGRALRVNFPQPAGTRFPRTPRNDFSPSGGGGGGGSSSYNSPYKLFVGNLAWGVDDVGLEQLFSDYGTVIEARVVMDRATGKSKGFGFVTLSSAEEVSKAISGLDGYTFERRQLRVNMAGDKPPPRDDYSTREAY